MRRPQVCLAKRAANLCNETWGCRATCRRCTGLCAKAAQGSATHATHARTHARGAKHGLLPEHSTEPSARSMLLEVAPWQCVGASRTAYASLLTLHPAARTSTFLAAASLVHQVHLLQVLMRTLRREWECKRDFIILLGQHVASQLPAKHIASLRAEGAILHSIPILVPGVPPADKLHAWRLTNYSKVLVLDADVMVLQSLDAAFDYDEEFAVALHPHDMIQAQCGLPAEQRGVSAMFVARPNLATFDALTAYVRTFNSFHLQHFSEQTALVCYFANRSTTLPQGYLFDIANPLHSPGASKWLLNCVAFGAEQMRRACLPGRGTCSSFATKSYAFSACGAIIERVKSHYEWSRVAGSVRAVHFKGKVKPWASEAHKQSVQCHPQHGSLKVDLADEPTGSRNLTTAERIIRLQPNDTLTFNPNHQIPGWKRTGACFSKKWKLPVYWAKKGNLRNTARAGPLLRRCCNFEMLLTAHWNNHLFGRPT